MSVEQASDVAAKVRKMNETLKDQAIALTPSQLWDLMLQFYISDASTYPAVAEKVFQEGAEGSRFTFKREVDKKILS
ncbi:MAG: hypothetical protein HQK52_21145 [Oligoflexia bacterium]|nr:hypothetical protein [Oligoflexia bacterium]